MDKAKAYKMRVKCEHGELPSQCGPCMDELRRYAIQQNLAQMAAEGLLDRIVMPDGKEGFRISPKGRRVLASERARQEGE